MLDTIEAGAAEGLTVVEFGRGDEPNKMLLADGARPLYEGLGLARTPQGHAYVAWRAASIHLRRRLKRWPALRRAY
jgi:CelD/BcsL family acetyltransferase involved in cellulose biosynthesis